MGAEGLAACPDGRSARRGECVTGGGQPTRRSSPTPGSWGAEPDAEAWLEWSAGADRTVVRKLVHATDQVASGLRSEDRIGFDLGRSAARSDRDSLGRRDPTPAVTRRHSDQVCVIDDPRRDVPSCLAGRTCTTPTAFCLMPVRKRALIDAGWRPPSYRGRRGGLQASRCVRCGDLDEPESPTRARREWRELAGAGSSMSVS